MNNLKDYKVSITYRTQRDYFFATLSVQAESFGRARLIALGRIFYAEHQGKDRYIKIVDIQVEEV